MKEEVGKGPADLEHLVVHRGKVRTIYRVPDQLHSNQGRRLDLVLDDLTPDDLAAATKAGWLEFRNHTSDTGIKFECECPVLEILAQLYELGYRLSKDEP